MDCDWGQGTICGHMASVLLVCGNFNGEIYEMFVCSQHADDLTYNRYFPCMLYTDKYGEILVEAVTTRNLGCALAQSTAERIGER